MYDAKVIADLARAQEAYEQRVREILAAAGATGDGQRTQSGLPLKPVYTPVDVGALDHEADLGFPGDFPYTRGTRPTGYQTKGWTRRQVVGLGTAEETNERLRYLLSQGQTGFSVCGMGYANYDSDSEHAEGFVGRGGVWMDTLADMETLLAGIDMRAITINQIGHSIPIFAMILAVAEQRGIPIGALRGTIQNYAGARVTALARVIAACRAEVTRIHDQLEEVGVSVEVVYTLDTISRALDRLECLAPLAAGVGAAPAEVRQLLGSIARGVVGERSFGQLMSDNLRLLARKVIERAGRTGEDYVASSRREYWKMLGSAAGGGVITAGTAITKFLIKWQHLPLFVDGVASSVAYAASFLIIQFLGFTLATKQPSMTAAALAGTIRSTGADRLETCSP